MAGVAPPEVLCVDRDCCGNTLLRGMFEEWEQMTIRLDLWHFMRRFAVGCTTDFSPVVCHIYESSQPLYFHVGPGRPDDPEEGEACRARS